MEDLQDVSSDKRVYILILKRKEFKVVMNNYNYWTGSRMDVYETSNKDRFYFYLFF